MSLLDTLSGLFGGERVRIEKDVKILAPSEVAAREVICYRCERELGPFHDDEKCRDKGMSRRVFFGLMGASAAALAARVDGIPFPGATVQVRAYAGDMFSVETLGAFTIAWDAAKTRHGNPFKSDDGVIQAGGLLEFHGQDLARPDQWLRVHRGLAEMNILGVVEKETGRPVKFKMIRSDEVEKLVGEQQKKAMQDHDAAAVAVMAKKFELEAQMRVVAAARLGRERAERRVILDRFDDEWRDHPSVLRAAGDLTWDNPISRPKGYLPV